MAVTCFLFVVFLLLNASESGTCEFICDPNDKYMYWDPELDFDPNLCSFYYKKFEQSLRKNFTTLWQLQQIFVHDDPVYVTLDVTVNATTICTNHIMSWSNESQWAWYYKSLSTVIDIPLLSKLDATTVSSLIVGLSPGDSPPQFDLMLYLGELPCSSTPTEDIVAALPPFLSWLKAYAKWHGEPDSWDSNDKGFIISDYDYRDYLSSISPRVPGSYEVTRLLIAGYVCELIFVFILVLKFVPGYYQVLSEKMYHNATIYSMYWGSVCTIILSNMIFLFFHIVAFFFSCVTLRKILCPYRSGSFYTLREFVVLYVAIPISLLSLAALVAMWIVCKTNRQNGVRMPIPTKAGNVLLICCCFCFCCNRNKKSIAVQIVVLWNILIFVFAFVTSTIPLFFLIILHTSKTLSILSLIFSTFFFFIILVAHLFHLGRSSVWKLCTNIFATLLFSGIVAIFIVVYIVCLNDGVQTKGIGGFLISLLPSAFLSIIGWYIKRKFLKPADINDAETGSLVEYENPDTQINSNVYPSTQTLASSPTEHTPLIQQEN